MIDGDSDGQSGKIFRVEYSGNGNDGKSMLCYRKIRGVRLLAAVCEENWLGLMAILWENENEISCSSVLLRRE